MLKKIAHGLIGQAEKRVGVTFDYVHAIADTSFSLLTRYNRLFRFLDPNRFAPQDAYHVARLRGAISADCGTCVEAEINLARQTGMDAAVIDQVLSGTYSALPEALAATARLADAVTGQRTDDPDARETIRSEFGEEALIELCFAMTGAALLPGIKRGMGYATGCDIEMMRKIAKA